ncbi:MAG: Spy/CpxP family protein refolding chaperone [Geminocystis sp.]|nr:Spy/CpxP family protein refolding chaperone [Geminocystis sp.]HIK36782.1 Spy/CpxP family protein refolding chaperone [Geminocystis sp. M7585_C2015_104]MCS7146872.1 Spy/CpxP family protein refolding chaperone [Geminocystis sp.]MCX8078892.1 Spy/CpxP family protein refolding chaperone [Geminocystis sp.]MDW8115697.1 Spy/CpxP family protein refolding chaperone [Geminocystis sp.]
MNKLITGLAFVTLLASSGVNTAVLAQGMPSPGMGNENRGWMKEDKMMGRLNLTPEQRQKMAAVREKYRPQISSLKEQLRAERDTLQEMMARNESETTLRNQHQKIIALEQKIKTLSFESMLEMRSILTPEQRQQWASWMKERRASRPSRPR